MISSKGNLNILGWNQLPVCFTALSCVLMVYSCPGCRGLFSSVLPCISKNKQAGLKKCFGCQFGYITVRFATFHVEQEGIFSCALLPLTQAGLCAGVCQSSWWAAVCGKHMHECWKGLRGRQAIQNEINITFWVIYNHGTPSLNPSISEVWSGVMPQVWSCMITSSHQSWHPQIHQRLFTKKQKADWYDSWILTEYWGCH